MRVTEFFLLFLICFCTCRSGAGDWNKRHVDSSHHLTDSTINCSNQKELLKFERNSSGVVAPFAHGHSKDAFFATLLGHPVVVKRPRNDFALDKLDKAAKEFTNELDRVHQLRGGHPGIPRYFGSCLTPRAGHGSELTLVTERLDTWWEFHVRPLRWCQRVYSAISMVSLARFLEGAWDPQTRPKGRGFLHCSINRAQFAYGPHGETKLIDYGGLHRFDEGQFPAYQLPCSRHDVTQCEGACMRSWAHGHYGTIGEFQCDQRHGQCRGFDPSANLWVLCESMMSEIMSGDKLTSTSNGNGGEPRLDTKPIDQALHRCMAQHKRDRISSAELHQILVKFLTANDQKYSCLKQVKLDPDPIYMNYKKPLRSL